jgi:hypothetical protein
LLDGYRAILGDHEVRAILIVLQTARKAPKTGLDLLASVEYFRPDFEGD